MSSKRAERRRACDGKAGYATADAANAAVANLRRRDGDWLRAYMCSFCQRWHIGHPPRSVRQSLAAKARNRRAAR